MSEKNSHVSISNAGRTYDYLLGEAVRRLCSQGGALARGVTLVGAFLAKE